MNLRALLAQYRGFVFGPFLAAAGFETLRRRTLLSS
jgi:hypothetical protein